MAIGGVIILIYIMMWFNGILIYDLNKNFFYNLGFNSILIIGVLSFSKDLTKVLKIRKNNKLKMQDSSNDTSKNDNSVTWQKHLEKNYKSTGTKTKMNDIKTSNNTVEETLDGEVKLKKQNHLKHTIINSLLIISLSINILLFVSIISVNNNIDQIKKDYDLLKNKNSQMCKWHLHFTENGVVKECNE